MTDFGGFPKQTVAFLRGLSKNNTKEWFTEHRSDYDDYWVDPAKDFVVAAGEALQKVAPVEFQPKVNGSIFRVNRDVRFSNDKRPYKDHLDFWFWEGERKTAASGFFLRITSTELGLGVGAHSFDKDRLAAYRDAVVDSSSGPSLVKATKAVAKAGFPAKGEHYKKLPRGYEASNADPELLLRYAALWCGEDIKHPKELHTGGIVKYTVDGWKKLAPLHRWLVDNIG